MNEIETNKKLISETKSQDIANLISVSINMVDKYKRFTHLPRLDKAIKIEDELGIPARAWVELKKYKEDNNAI